MLFCAEICSTEPENLLCWHPAPIEPAAKLRRAAQRSAAFDTVGFEMVVSADGEQMSRIVSQGTADGSRARMTVDVPGVGEMQVLLVDGTYYYGFPGLPDGIEWASMSADEVAAISGVDPTAAGARQAAAAAASRPQAAVKERAWTTVFDDDTVPNITARAIIHRRREFTESAA